MLCNLDKLVETWALLIAKSSNQSEAEEQEHLKQVTMSLSQELRLHNQAEVWISRISWQHNNSLKLPLQPQTARKPRKEQILKPQSQIRKKPKDKV